MPISKQKNVCMFKFSRRSKLGLKNKGLSGSEKKLLNLITKAFFVTTITSDTLKKERKKQSAFCKYSYFIWIFIVKIGT